jgi:hypothetical protein
MLILRAARWVPFGALMPHGTHRRAIQHGPS